MESRDRRIDNFIEQNVAYERSIEPDPFLSTRLIGRMESVARTMPVTTAVIPVWVFKPVIITSFLLVAAGTGILLGWARDPARENLYSAPVEALRNELFISDFTEESAFLIHEE